MSIVCTGGYKSMTDFSSVNYKFSLKLQLFSFIQCVGYLSFAFLVLFSALLHLTLSPGRLTYMDCIHGPLCPLASGWFQPMGGTVRRWEGRRGVRSAYLLSWLLSFCRAFCTVLPNSPINVDKGL